ncbi:hypothetical protein, conserved [Trypanosoma brucei brucei TREU927]|uniref:FYVE-type domain-containing protein n=1 Tax=Trypanosoma brucei brucei (strain 927/4 GUTat10.1) TaxID=185431 RepID=Q57U01_TRYB2|nr:hypothetical protein, conserved [Trypanosoma brucei brucei TREU927]AAX70917.1 hypothetical protein, conserved [Trypanosoma brucei]AAZ12118.1 hypothetical protein, conserved [Trypanosoma brucei brucei TREU927]
MPDNNNNSSSNNSEILTRNEYPTPAPPAFFNASPVLTLPVTLQKVTEFDPAKQENLSPHTLPDGSEYYGDMLLDKPHGLGIVIFKDTSSIYGSGDRYGGRWANGAFHGEGVLNTTRFTYEGEFNSGRMCGRGKITYKRRPGEVSKRGVVPVSQYELTHPPKEYEGDFHHTYHRHGRGILRYANGDVYKGEFNSNSRHGRGRLECASGEVYDGEWLKDERHGGGKVSYVDGGEFKGMLVRGKRDGEGCMRYPNGDEYFGNFSNDKIEGRGTMRYKNGDIYEGMWKGGLRHGEGKSTLHKLGAIVEGDFVQGLIHGKGVVKYPGVSTFVGVFENGERKHGTMFWHRVPADGGICYQGEWVGEMRQGRGLVWYENGDFFFGSFVKNMRHGGGNLRYADGSEYSGNFVNDVREGEGILQRKNGSIQAGIWRNDVLVDGYDGEWDGVSFNGVGSLVFRNLLAHKGKGSKGGGIPGSLPAGGNSGKSGDGAPSGDVTTSPLLEHFGVFCQGVRHGPGVLRLCGHVLIGNWINDTLSCDSGSWEFPSGDLYVGSFKDGFRNGPGGRMWFTDGSYFSGDWRLDSPIGVGLYHAVSTKNVTNPAEECLATANTAHQVESQKEEQRDGSNTLMSLFTSFFRNEPLKGEKECEVLTTVCHEHYLLRGEWRPTVVPYSSCQLLVAQCAAAAISAPDVTAVVAKVKKKKQNDVVIGKPPVTMCLGLQEGSGVVLFNSGVCMRADWVQSHPKLVFPHRANAPYHGEILKQNAEKNISEAPLSESGTGKVCAVCEKPFTFFRKELKCAICDRVCCNSCYNTLDLRDHPKLEALMRQCKATPIGDSEAEAPAVVNSPSQLQACTTCISTLQLEAQFITLWLPMRYCNCASQEGEETGAVGGGEDEDGKTPVPSTPEGKEESVNPDLWCTTGTEQGTCDPRAQTKEDEYIIYEGYISSAIPHIFGSLWWGKNEYYLGGFKEGRRHGFGTQILWNGETYTGGFADDKWHGEGAYSCSDGTAYAGTWENGALKTIKYHGELDSKGRQHGRGQSYGCGKDGKSRYNGEWKHGVWHGSGILQDDDGFLYSGEFTSGRIEGMGKLLLGGSVYYGNFVAGKQHGHGFELFSGECAVVGEWRNGVLCGSVAIHDAATESVYETTYANGNERDDCFMLPVMVNDDKASHCSLCSATFTFFIRRHHCRLCGEVFCDACSQSRASMPPHFKMDGQQRVCDRCFQRLKCGRMLAIRRYGRNREVYAGCWSQGQWVSRGLFRRADGSVIVTNMAGRPILDCDPSTDGMGKGPSFALHGCAALPPVDELRKLPASPDAEVEAFKLWWEVTSTVIGLAVPLNTEPIESFTLPRPPHIRAPNLFSMLDGGNDNAAAVRAANFRPAIPPPPPPFPALDDFKKKTEVKSAPPQKPVITETSVFSRIVDRCAERLPLGSPPLGDDDDSTESVVPSRYTRKDLLPPVPACPPSGMDDRIVWSDWAIRRVPKYGGIAALSGTGSSTRLPEELNHVPFACSFVPPVVPDADRVVLGTERRWRPEPFKCPQEFTIDEAPNLEVIVQQRDRLFGRKPASSES